VFTELLELTPSGLCCPAGDFYIDPWRPVDRAIITHAHADHARPGSRRYLAAKSCEDVLRCRLGQDIDLRVLDYGERIDVNGVTVSLHPAGHVLGSAQVRLERDGDVAVVSGDYKRQADATCAPFEPVRCRTFVTESTFGLPIYRWDEPRAVFAEIDAWWRVNAAAGEASLLLAYALGKAQRLMAGVDASIGPIYTHGATERVTRAYRDSGVSLPATIPLGEGKRGPNLAGSLVIAPPSAEGTPWAKKLGPYSAAVASGWMRVRGTRRRRSVDRGFVLSDHADWPGLLDTIRETGAENVLVTHGSSTSLVRVLRELGLKADVLETHFADDPQDAEGHG